jgi:hypothetical protein
LACTTTATATAIATPPANKIAPLRANITTNATARLFEDVVLLLVRGAPWDAKGNPQVFSC